ncbi:hypothetical protein HETIRDRAFT_431593 [Heterobasidion irregulare TC 32-1]|uniref:Acyl-CoA desaturase n=1 Tax=Heterobasidion irregulare (strain TC 32-1) TaxID=747525 RepID=W4KMW6_HETIT|nr:uncharacterized protein HETIRDRAFT_431593 [Heterobasidion irregulare TC 32-1]ETW87157.1 hypothetical protein HETIRDRAFT_431593 [Heterobasidion irregulare TC 32-1]
MSTTTPAKDSSIWWSNAFFFVGVHLAAAYGVYVRPPQFISWQILAMTVVLWQLASFGVTVGYHRLYSHRAFRATFGVRLALAILGTSAMQGSIKWWCLRHRLHHRFTDDDVHDPYSATRGLVFSHVGWIFYKTKYERLELIDREDLERDPVVCFQHKYYVPLALSFGFVLPTVLGLLWGDPWGGYIWGGLVSRLLIWHCTFLVNSLAHWDGLQPYSDDNTSRTNWILALLTAGEGNHNFHAFPHDFRSGPALFDWDPSKWVILILHRLGLVTGLRRAHEDDIKHAEKYMEHKAHAHVDDDYYIEQSWDGEVWDTDRLGAFIKNKPTACIILLNGFAVDATDYMKEHPGGALLLRQYSVLATDTKIEAFRDATWAFEGGLNRHSRAAHRRMMQLRVAKVALARVR